MLLKRGRSMLATGLVVGLSALAAGCGGADEPADTAESTPTAQEQQAVTFVTDFGFNGRHSYYYVALDKGYYEEEGLDVTIERGNGSADAIKQVGAGQAQLGFADAATLVLSRGNDDVPVKMVAAIYQKPPQAIYALESSGIREPADLEGKTLADSAGSAVPAMFPVYAEAAGIDENRVRWTVADSAALPSLLATGRVDGIGQFIVGEPLLERAVEDRPLTRLAYSDVGLDYYGNGIVASEDVLESDPEMVEKFVRATIRGMEYAFENPEEAGQIFNEAHPEIDAAVATGETELVADLAEAPGGGGLGTIEPARVESTIEVVSEAFDLQGEVAPEDVYADGFVE